MKVKLCSGQREEPPQAWCNLITSVLIPSFTFRHKSNTNSNREVAFVVAGTMGGVLGRVEKC